MGCCGCSLSDSTVTAAVLGLVESIVGMTWNILVIAIIQTSPNNETFPNTSVLLNVTENIFYEDQKQSDMWGRFKKTITSKESLETQHISELVITALVLNCFWMITTIALSVGNSEKCRDMLKPWIFTTVVIVITDIAATIYFTFRAVKEIEKVDLDADNMEILFIDNIFILCALLFSRGGIIVWVTNIALVVFVAQRVRELDILRRKRLSFDPDIRITPYTLNSPYEMFEADHSPMKPNVLKPHTPPPDYEAPGNERHLIGQLSFPTDYDASTLPETNMRGSHTSVKKKTFSTISNMYDDQVEIQHRNSAAAQNTILHAYDNRGLDLESEGWRGIPRPTLKTTH